MERWSGRVAVVTGASSGNGAAIAELLVKRGMKVVGLARREERIQALADRLVGAPGKLYAVKTDVSKEEDILAAFKWVKDNLGGVDVLVNNAAVSPHSNLSDGKTSDWKQLLDVNLLALSIGTREAIKSMKEKGVDDGHIFHINSVAGHYILNFPGIYMYTATKHAIRALTEGLRKELVQLKSNIRVTSITPGLVDTPMVRGDSTAEEVLKGIAILQPEDVAEAVEYALSRPARVQFTYFNQPVDVARRSSTAPARICWPRDQVPTATRLGQAARGLVEEEVCGGAVFEFESVPGR